MTDGRERLRARYEIALSIGPGETLAATAENALSAYLTNLDCSAGAVIERTEASTGVTYNPVEVVPADPGADLIEDALAQLPAGADRDGTALDVLPRTVETEDGICHLLELPGFGVLVLGDRTDPLPETTVTALKPLNEKLAAACKEKRDEARLQEDRTRFEAVFDTIPDPVIHAVSEDGTLRIRDVNGAFEETFGYNASTARGQRLVDLIVPDQHDESVDAGPVEERATTAESISREVRRETDDGVGDFLFRGATVGEIDDEFLAMYVEITDVRDQHRKVERLYDETGRILAGEDREAIAERVIHAVENVLGVSNAGVHLYDRDAEGLAPVATTDSIIEAFDGDPPVYRNRETVVWDVYRSGNPEFISDVDAYDGTLPSENTPIGSALLFPLGAHGVLFLSALEPGAFDDTDIYFGRLLSRTVGTSLDRAQREHGLRTIQSTVQDAVTAESYEGMARTVLDRIPEVLDLPLVAIWEHNAVDDRLEPVAQSNPADPVFSEMPTFEPGNSIAWQAFENGTVKRVSRTGDYAQAHDPESPIQSEIISPIGEFGVIAAGSTYEASFSDVERQIIESLAGNLRTASRLIDRQRDLNLLDQVFARILRHNLRNRLNIIQGHARTLLKSSNERTAETAETLIRNCEKLDETARNAQKMRAAVQRSDETATVSLRQVVKESIAAVQERFSGTAVRTSFEAEPTVVVHPNLGAAIQQLVRNGIEHDTTDSPPRVDVSVYRTGNGPIIEIADDGPGIPDHELEILEQHGESKLEHGSGAGLWLVDLIADYSNASVEFQVDDGTVVQLVFPR
jgi:PAS domain S-box-containing protein